MSQIKVNQNLVNQEIADKLIKLCPFQAFDYSSNVLSISAACRVCKICVNKGPKGVCEFIEEKQVTIDKTRYSGIAVFIEHRKDTVHKVSYELIGKAKELALVTKEEVFAILIGNDTLKIQEEVLKRGVDKVVVYDNKFLNEFNIETYTNVIEAFFLKYQVNVILFGGSARGRSLAPRVAARLKTGLTADCTMLDISKEGDLLQIRPAFGGNIMAKIKTLNHRPQLATIRYKVFQEPHTEAPHGEVILETMEGINKVSKTKVIHTEDKPDVLDISDAEVIIALGRGFRKQKDLELIEPLRKSLNAQIACTRPLIENGWIDPRRQIGLSGRTVKPKLLICIGIQGSVQFIEGMKESEMIISINSDPHNKLFEMSHYAILGDLYEILPKLNEQIESLKLVKR